MNNIITAAFRGGEYEARAYRKNQEPIWQWAYGQILQIHGLDLPAGVEIHFCFEGQPTDTRIGTTVDRVTEVAIPDKYVETAGTVIAYIYLSDTRSGQTEYKVTMEITERERPQPWDRPEDEELFKRTIETVNAAADRAGESEKLSERWAVGREDMPESMQDNAKYYAGRAADQLKEIPVQIEKAKEHIDEYTKEKESELKGDTGNVYFASFRVVNGRLKMYSDPTATKIAFRRDKNRLKYRVAIGGNNG